MISDVNDIDAGTHLLSAETCRGQSETGMIFCQCRNAQAVSRNTQGMISDRNDPLSMQKRTSCEQECTVDDQ